MNRVLLIITISSIFLSCNTMEKNNNPLLMEFNTIHQTVPFDLVKTEHYMPAFEEALIQARKDISDIVTLKDEPTFENTIVAIEESGALLEIVASVFFNLNSSHTNDTIQALALEVSPKLTKFSNDVSLNEDLFKRVKSVYDNVDRSTLTKEQMTLLNEAYKGFSRNGAALTDDKKEQYRVITEELSTLSLEFHQNVLAETNDFQLHLTDDEQVKGLPSYVLEMGASEAKSREKEGYVFTLQSPSMIPFMQYSQRRDLREKLWKAYAGRCFGDSKFNNETIVKRVVELRLKKAELLGYETHADYVLEERMAENRGNVNDFLAELLAKSLPYAQEDVKKIKEYAKNSGADFELMPWDFSFYSDKLKDEEFSINDEILKPYFELQSTTDGVFELCNRLYGITFVENKEIVPYQEDVQCYEVFDEDGSFLSVLYLDFFPRESKSGGAWMTSFKSQFVKDNKDNRPHISVVCNFTKPTESTPSLLTFYELTTYLHEFGHALHGMFSNGTYRSISGTNVAWDFVELPSQIMENYATEKEFLSLFATHYKTGEIIPNELVDKIIASKKYLSGYSSVRQLSFGINDMAWHSITTPVEKKVQEFEREAIEETQVLSSVDEACLSSSFSHIFAGGYAAGYYSYKWAEVLEADAFSLFKEKGIFNKDVAKSFRDNILSKGSTEDEMTLFVNFRGRKPKMDALLEKLN